MNVLKSAEANPAMRRVLYGCANDFKHVLRRTRIRRRWAAGISGLENTNTTHVVRDLGIFLDEELYQGRFKRRNLLNDTAMAVVLSFTLTRWTSVMLSLKVCRSSSGFWTLRGKRSFSFSFGGFFQLRTYNFERSLKGLYQLTNFRHIQKYIPT